MSIFQFCLTVLVASGLYLANPAYAETPPIRDLMAIEEKLNYFCRGGGVGDALMEICDIRDKAAKLLNKMGYCYGKEGQYGYQKQWHKCTRGSERLQE